MIKSILLATLFLPIPVFAQQVSVYDVCTRYREVYVPGYYDSYGNYVSGRVNTESYRVSCSGRVVEQSTAYPTPVRRCYAAPLGTIAGGFAAYKATSSVPNRWWSVPLGAVTGGLIGSAICR